MSPLRLLLTPSLAALAVVATAADGFDVQIHGFVSQGYLLTKGNHLFGDTKDEGTFDFNEFALSATATPIERLRVGMQIFAFDLGDIGEDKLALDWAFGDYRIPVSQAVEVGIIAGRFKIIHGLYNDQRDLDVARPQVFLPQSVYPAAYRDIFIAMNGAQLYGRARTDRWGSFELNLMAGGQNFDENDSGIAAALLDTGLVASVDQITIDSIVGAALTWETPIDGLRLRLSAVQARGFEAEATGVAGLGNAPLLMQIPDYSMVTISAEWQRGAFTFASEYQLNDYRLIIDAGAPVSANLTNLDFSVNSFYASAAWRFHRAVEGFVGVEYAYRDDSNGGRKDTRGVTAGLCWNITDHWLLKAQYTHNDGILLLETSPNDVERDDWDVIAIKTTYDF